jgi:simple sugar transport system ATP-binding protein
MTNTPRLELRDITKSYPSVVANQRVSLRVMPGEIHAVLGENGAGKSTLMKIIYGVAKADEGGIFWNGKPVTISNPAEARRLGIAMVFQHFSLFETLTVAENIALAVDGPFDLGALAKRIGGVSERYGLPLNPGRLVHSLSVGERQRVEIVRCLLQEPELLIMDEPTSVLTPRAVQGLFETLRRLSEDGCSVLYISHKLEELRTLCHKATVMRNGCVVGTADPARETAAGLARLMVGGELPVCERSAPATGGEARLIIDGLSRRADDPFGTDLEEINLRVHSGEIVGIAGISGNGQQELLAALSGERPLELDRCAQIRIDGRQAGHLNAAERRDLRLTYVPEDRLGRGFDVRCSGVDAEARSLSGGNLQKFIVGREILQTPRVLIAAQPTWGVDVGAAVAIRQALVDLRSDGVAILLISEDLEELFEISDRVAVIAAGRLSPGKVTADTDIEEVGLLMGGTYPHTGESTVGA